MNNKLLDYLPKYVQDYREIKEIMLSEQEEFDDLWAEKDKILQNQYILSANEYGVSRYEKMLGILKKSADTLDERKFNILVKFNDNRPYTMNMLHEIIRNLCGDDMYQIIFDSVNYKLDVKISLKSKSNFDAVANMIKDFIPCNLIFNIDLIYNQHITLSSFKHSELAENTHYDLRNEVLTDGE